MIIDFKGIARGCEKRSSKQTRYLARSHMFVLRFISQAVVGLKNLCVFLFEEKILLVTHFLTYE